MRVDVEAARRGYRRSAVYPAAVLAGIFTNTVFGFIKGAVLVAVLATGTGVIGGYDTSDALTFAWITQALLMPVMMAAVWDEIALRIRSGDIATDLIRPLDVQRYWLASDFGRATYQAIFRGIPPFVIGALVYELHVPESVGGWFWFLISAALAVITSFGWRFLYNCAGFWTGDIRGIGLLALMIASIASGFYVPIPFFPDWLQSLVQWLPFAAMIQTPADIFLGKIQGAALLGAIGGQLTWAVILLVLGRVVLRFGTRRVVIQGG